MVLSCTFFFLKRNINKIVQKGGRGRVTKSSNALSNILNLNEGNFLRTRDLKKRLTTYSHLHSHIVHKVLNTSAEKKTVEQLV